MEMTESLVVCARVFFKDSLLYKHVKTCYMRGQVGGKHSTSTGRTLLNTELAEDKFREFFSNTLSRMKRDEYHLHVRNDTLLIQFGTLEMQKREEDRYNDISLKENADTKVTECQKFMYLYGGEYSIYANNARAVYRKRKAYVPEELPEEEDVKAVRSYCINKILRICRKVKENGMRKDDYRQLSKTTLVRLITFNARRGGEPSKLKLADWEGVKDDR